jgi:ABC-2 type transport system ATP-binding protein
MTVKEYLYFVSKIKQVPKMDRNNQVFYVMEVLRLHEVSHRLIKNLSKGYKQRVGLAQALIGDPEVLILDEPTVGLDPQQIIEIRELIKELGKKHTIILSSHILPEVSAVCSRIVVIHKGKIVAMDTTKNLMGMDQQNILIKIEVEGEHEKTIKILEGLTNLKGFEQLDGKDKNSNSISYLLTFEGDGDNRKELFFAFAKAKVPLLELSIQKRTLEDTYLQLLARSDEETSLLEKEILTEDTGVDLSNSDEEPLKEEEFIEEEDGQGKKIETKEDFQ